MNDVLALATPAAAAAAKTRARALVRVSRGERPWWHVLAGAVTNQALRRIRLDDLLAAGYGMRLGERNRFVARLRTYARVSDTTYDKDLTVAWAIRANARNPHAHLDRLIAIHDAADPSTATRSARTPGWPWTLTPTMMDTW